MAAESALTNNYTKGQIIVLDGQPDQQFPDLPENAVFVKVKRGSKIRNILGFAMKMFKDEKNRHIIFSGSGDAMEKTITCAEITKKKFKNPNQLTKIGYLRVEEYWDPKDEKSELDRLKVTREIPMINILLCKDPLDANEPGYQATPEKKSQKRKRTDSKGARSDRQDLSDPRAGSPD